MFMNLQLFSSYFEYTTIQTIDNVFYGLTGLISSGYIFHKSPMLRKKVAAYTKKNMVSGLNVEKPEFYISVYITFI